MLESLEGILLIIRCEFGGEHNESKCAKDTVWSAECLGMLTSCDVCWDTQEEQDNILYSGYSLWTSIRRKYGTSVERTNKGQVDDVKKPYRNPLPQDCPSVVFIAAACTI